MLFLLQSSLAFGAGSKNWLDITIGDHWLIYVLKSGWYYCHSRLFSSSLSLVLPGIVDEVNLGGPAVLPVAVWLFQQLLGGVWLDRNDRTRAACTPVICPIGG